MILTKTYDVYDYKLVDAMTSASGHWTYESSLSVSYNSDGALISSNSWSNNRATLDVQIPVSSQIEYDIGSITSTIYFKLIGTTNFEWYIQNNGRLNVNGTNYEGKGGTGHYKLIVNSDNVAFYKGTELITTVSMSVGTSNFIAEVGSACNMRIKDVKVKSL